MLNKATSIVSLAYVLSAGLMIYLGYFVPREDTWLLFGGFTLLFASVWVIIRHTNELDADLPYFWSILLRLLIIAS